MVYEIRGKVAVITGGASGIGLEYAKELLRNQAKGVALADLNPELGTKALQEIEREFGPNKAIFIQTDVTDYNQFEDAFKKTAEKYKNIDILINNAGILNDSIWQKEIAVNVVSTTIPIFEIMTSFRRYKMHLVLILESIGW
nr:unnamed protein product [Callosobruchus analis]